jgi:hypothetical protein
MCVCKCKSECARSSRRCSGSRIRRGHAGARADCRRRAWRPRVRFGQGRRWRGAQRRRQRGELQQRPAGERHMGSPGSRRWRCIAATASSGEGWLGQTVTRRGTAGRGQCGVGEGGGKAGEGTWTGVERRWRSGARHMAGTSGGGAAQRRNRGGREGGRRRRTEKQHPKNIGTLL